MFSFAPVSWQTITLMHLIMSGKSEISSQIIIQGTLCWGLKSFMEPEWAGNNNITDLICFSATEGGANPLWITFKRHMTCSRGRIILLRRELICDFCVCSVLLTAGIKSFRGIYPVGWQSKIEGGIKTDSVQICLSWWLTVDYTVPKYIWPSVFFLKIPICVWCLFFKVNSLRAEAYSVSPIKEWMVPLFLPEQTTTATELRWSSTRKSSDVQFKAWDERGLVALTNHAGKRALRCAVFKSVCSKVMLTGKGTEYQWKIWLNWLREKSGNIEKPSGFNVSYKYRKNNFLY